MGIRTAENLKKMREERSLTQDAVAEALGVSAITVYKWETGRLPPEYKMLVKTADFYGISVDSIISEETEYCVKTPVSDQLPENCRTVLASADEAKLQTVS